MSYNIRYPNIPDGPADMQVKYLKKALFQIIDQINFALSSIEKDKENVQNQANKT